MRAHRIALASIVFLTIIVISFMPINLVNGYIFQICSSGKATIYSYPVNRIVWLDTVEIYNRPFIMKIDADGVLITLYVYPSDSVKNYRLVISSYKIIDNSILLINGTLYTPLLYVHVSYAVDGNITYSLKEINQSWISLVIEMDDIRGYIADGLYPQLPLQNNILYRKIAYVGGVPIYFQKLSQEYLINLKTGDMYLKIKSGNHLLYLGTTPLFPYYAIKGPRYFVDEVISNVKENLEQLLSQKTYLQNIIKKVSSSENKTSEAHILNYYVDEIFKESMPRGEYVGYRYNVQLMQEEIGVIGYEQIRRYVDIASFNRTYLKQKSQELLESLKDKNLKRAEEIILGAITHHRIDIFNPEGLEKDILSLNFHWIYPIITPNTFLVLPVVLNSTSKPIYLALSTGPLPNNYHNLKTYIQDTIRSLEKRYHTNNIMYRYYPGNATIYFYVNRTIVYGYTFWPVDVNGTDYFNIVVHGDLYKEIIASNKQWSIYYGVVNNFMLRIKDIIRDFLVAAVTHGVNYVELKKIIERLDELQDNLNKYIPRTPYETLNYSLTTTASTFEANHTGTSGTSTVTGISSSYGLLAVLVIVLVSALVLIQLRWRKHRQ
ncbi:MAG: hypothetical protein GXO43_05290 [Crenarchaeota archaeon]|nr:hypothetical protein [Thermoproteota archaeon]